MRLKFNHPVTTRFAWMLLICIPALIFLGYMEFKLGTVPTGYSTRKAAFERQSERIEWLFTGASQSVFGINPAFMSYKSFNLGDVNQSLYYDVTLVRKYLTKMSSLKMVVLPLSYFTAGYEIEGNQEYWRKYFYQKVYDIKPLYNDWSIKAVSWYFLYGPVTSLYYLRNDFDEKFSAAIDTCGFQPMVYAKPLRDSALLAKADVNRHFALLKFKWYACHLQLVRELAIELQQRNITLVLLNMPLRPAYDQQVPTFMRYMHHHFTKELLQEKNVRYLDLSAIQGIPESHFLDHFHLNYKGAEMFSRLLSDSLKGLDGKSSIVH